MTFSGGFYDPNVGFVNRYSHVKQSSTPLICPSQNRHVFHPFCSAPTTDHVNLLKAHLEGFFHN